MKNAWSVWDLIKIIFFPFLYMLALAYSFAVSTHRRWLSRKGCLRQFENLFIICIGNLSLGGTGKTPHLIWLAKQLAPRYRLAILSRGYGRKWPGIREVGLGDLAEACGDEPLEIKQALGGQIPVWVAEDRAAGIEALLQVYPKTELILLDDGFQHWKLAKDYHILLTTFDRPYHEDYPLPLGQLRESRAGYQRAQTVILTKCPEAVDLKPWRERLGLSPAQGLLSSRLVYGAWRPWQGQQPSLKPEQLPAGSQLRLLTGIARPEPILAYLAPYGFELLHFRFGDHHAFKAKDLEAWLSGEANSYYLSTEKDAQRLRSQAALLSPIASRLYILPLDLAFEPSPQAWLGDLEAAIAHKKSAVGS